MWVAVRKDDNVSGVERNWPAVALEMRIPAAFSQQVKDDDVAASIGEIGRQHARSRGAEAPGRGKLRIVEHRAVEADGLKHFGQDIHWTGPPLRPAGRQTKPDGQSSEGERTTPVSREPDSRLSRSGQNGLIVPHMLFTGHSQRRETMTTSAITTDVERLKARLKM